MQQRTAQIAVALVAAHQHPGAHHIHDQADDGHGQHGPGKHFGGLPKALHGFPGNPGHEQQQRCAIGQCGQHAHAVKATGAQLVGRARGNAVGNQGQQQRRRVGQHVAGVGNQGQRTRQPAAHHLHQGIGQRDDKHPLDTARVRGGHRRRMRMPAGAMVMGVRMRVGMIVAVFMAMFVIVFAGGHRVGKRS
ncbi:hypothetical protein D3C86_1534420 [compost metagenome]